MITTGKVAFDNLREHEMYQGKTTGRYSVTLTMEDSEADKLAGIGVKLREYEGNQQRKFASQYEVQVVDLEGMPFKGAIPRDSIVRVQWKSGNTHPVHGTPTYLNAVRVLEVAESVFDEDDEL